MGDGNEGWWDGMGKVKGAGGVREWELDLACKMRKYSFFLKKR